MESIILVVFHYEESLAKRLALSEFNTSTKNNNKQNNAKTEQIQ